MQHKLRTTIWHLSLLVGCALVGVRIQADSNWAGTAVSSTDQNVNILADSIVSGPVTVAAVSANIAVNVVGGPRTLFGNGRLMFQARNGRSITVNVPASLTFQGDNSNNNLLIGVCADQNSTVNFVISDSQSVILRGDAPTNLGGAQFFVIMQNGVTTPALQFSRLSAPSAGDVSLVIGARSLMSFLATDVLGGTPAATSFGAIQFNPQNAGTGRMIMRIENDGSFLVTGNRYSGDCYAEHFLANEVDFFTPAGQQAVVQVNGSLAATSRLLVINSNSVLSPLMIDPFNTGAFSAGDGIRRGFVVGGNGNITLLDGTYLDYVGETLNMCPPPCGACNNLKARNPSALIVDGVQVGDGQFTANFNLQGSSAIYFRSGVANDGSVNEPLFLVAPAETTPGFGNIVFDVEGPLSVLGASNITNALQLLSIQVAPTGGSVTIDSSETTFPLRTFATDINDQYLQYNKGAFLINNSMSLFSTSLVHTDMLHKVYEKDDVLSEATYIGGESFQIKGSERPSINLINSLLRLHTSAAFTGVDLDTPNLDSLPGNSSEVVFYANGFCIDQGDGRNLIMGTRIGALACDNGTIINQDAHINVMQTTAQDASTLQQLELTVGANNDTIIQNVPDNIANQPSLHSLYLGHASNISVGTEGGVGTDSQGMTFPLTTTPTLRIVGNYIGFETRGGPESMPEVSGLSGRGGIFVDSNGVITLSCPTRAFFGTMVTKSGNGLVDLPINQILFHNRVGIQGWQIDLSDPAQQVIIAANENLPDYTLDWASVKKDCNNFIPFQANVCAPCESPQASMANITSVPVVKGIVDQLQIAHSQYGNQATIMVDGGLVRELIFLEGTKTGQAAVGVLAIQNDGEVGLGNANTNLDSDSGAVKLGATGLIIIPNGAGIIDLNSDIEVDNITQIVAGPDFGLYGPQKLVVRANVPRQFLVKTGGVLDLSSFNSPNRILEFDGFVRLVFEPGSKLVLGGGTLNFTGYSSINFEPFINATRPAGTALSSTDDIRVRIIGTGSINLLENATGFIPRDAYVGIETLNGCATTTSITLSLSDFASFKIGDGATFGGSLQIGDTTATYGNSVNFNLVLNGLNALFQIDSQGFLGLGVGIVNKPDSAPNTWTVGALNNLGAISFVFTQGVFQHNQIRDGGNELAGLLAVGPATSYSLSYNPIDMTVLGGGNLIEATSLALFAPIVTTIDGTINANYAAGILSSGLMLTDASKAALPLVNVTPAALFSFLKVLPTVSQTSTQSTIARDTAGTATLGYVFGSSIVRTDNFVIVGATGRPVDNERSLQIGSVGFSVDATGVITTVAQNNTVNALGA